MAEEATAEAVPLPPLADAEQQEPVPTAGAEEARGIKRGRTAKWAILKSQLVRREWRLQLEVPSWRKRVGKALERLGRPLPEETEGLDISTVGVRTATVEELTEAMLRRRLRAEGLLPECEDEEERLVEAAAINILEGGKEGLSEKEQQEQQESTRTEGRTEGRVGGRLRGRRTRAGGRAGGRTGGGAGSRAGGRAGGKEGPPESESPQKKSTRTDGDTGDSLPAVLPLREVEKLRRARANTASAQLAWKNRSEKEFVFANRGSSFCVYANGVVDEPHKRWRERLSVREDAPRLVANEIILSIVVCNTLGHKDQEFDVLLSQPLHDLRDALYFASDWMFDGPTRIKSGCFFIDGIFYSDMRDPTAVDYSAEIIEWVKHTRESGFLRKEKSMPMTMRFCDLDRIPFGERCVYVHQGDLEHSVYFTNARLVQPCHDCIYREAYPILTFMRRHMKRKCYVCWQNFAMWLVLDSHRCPHNPSFWCGQCFRHFHQDADGEYLCPVDYKVFPYLHEDT